jgi:hypothetical protein
MAGVTSNTLATLGPAIITPCSSLDHKLAPQTNTSLFYTLLSSVVCTWEVFPITHPPQNFFRPSMLIPRVLYSWDFGKEGIPWWYEYSILISPEPGCHNHPRKKTDVPVDQPQARNICSWPDLYVQYYHTVLYVQLVAFVPYHVRPRGPT